MTYSAKHKGDVTTTPTTTTTTAKTAKTAMTAMTMAMAVLRFVYIKI